MFFSLDGSNGYNINMNINNSNKAKMMTYAVQFGNICRTLIILLTNQEINKIKNRKIYTENISNSNSNSNSNNDIMDMNSKEIEEEENKEECSEVLVSESQGKQSKIII